MLLPKTHINLNQSQKVAIKHKARAAQYQFLCGFMERHIGLKDIFIWYEMVIFYMQ